jgi:diguanylate cyclase (GGDEF)-like protein
MFSKLKSSKLFPFYRIAFVHVDLALSIREASPNLVLFIDRNADDVLGKSICDVLLELSSLEADLQAILAGQLPAIILNNVHRTGPNGETVYTTLHIGLYDDDNPAAGLLVVIEDVTRIANLEQKLTQDRNELQLLKRQLANFNQELIKYALLDSLTGLPNRRFLFQEMDRLHKRLAAKQIACFALLFLDVDNFKSQNDTYGHLVGDHLLQAVAQILRYHIRQFDSACRYGGDEFAILMPNLPVRHASEVCERLLIAVRTNPLILKFTTDSAITFSVGLAMSPMDGTTSDDLLHAADQALYAAKSAGKNQVVIYSADMNPLRKIDLVGDDQPDE